MVRVTYVAALVAAVASFVNPWMLIAVLLLLTTYLAELKMITDSKVKITANSEELDALKRDFEHIKHAASFSGINTSSKSTWR